MRQASRWRTSALFALALVVPALMGIGAGSAPAADKLRVGKAQAQPFTFAPLYIEVITEKYLPGAAK